MAAPRAKLACASCTRRKVRCSKEIPCSNCIRRGEQDSCSTGAGLASTSPASSHTFHAPAISPASTNDTEIDHLRIRVAELEAELRRRHSPASPHPLPGGPPGAQPAPSYLPTPEVEAPDPDAKHAASILEFLSWGRKKNPDYHDVSLEASEAMGNPSDVRDVDAGVAFPEFTQDWFKSQLAMIQSLLPPPPQVWQLERFHAESLLWYHGSYHAPTFHKQLQGFYDRFGGSVSNPGVNLQWVAMLFAVLTGSMTAAPDDLALSWGFRESERGILSRQWYRATIRLLNLAEYTANQSILSTQAIATITISAHQLGFSNMQSVHLAAANKIAQALGLQKLGAGCEGSPVEVEAGRRVWCQLTTQDWFSIPFSESYMLNPLYSRSLQPLNCHEEELTSLPDTIPTVMTYSRYLQGIAAIMPRLQDDLMQASTEYTKYMEVRKWDERIRRMLTHEAPPMLSSRYPIDPDWPPYVPWARRALAISGYHKVIMVHRSFLSESFTNPTFAYTRKTCLAASRTIISEYKMVIKEDGPILWIHQAFAVAAAIILALDMLHRSPVEDEFHENKALVEDTVAIIGRCRNSMIAQRGEKLLSALLMEVERCIAESKKRKLGDDRQKPRVMNVSAFVKRFCEGPAAPSPSPTPAANVGLAQSELSAALTTAAPFDGDHAVLFGTEFGAQDGPGLHYPAIDGCFENLVWLANNDFAGGYEPS
ncbi:hypothetical protein GQ53DRAFT_644158 [Thozetella sp. PMI_491]|nr:hypothetical protein GQ53DRAFT_644158 [Thozetella sp. PMI_491]